MNFHIYIILASLISLFLNVSCQSIGTNNNEVALSDDVKKIVVTLDNDSPILVSDFIDSIRYVPLETSDQCLIQNIDQLEIYNDNIIILDQTTNSIFFFNKNGKFLRKIEFNQSPTSSISIYRFNLNREDSTIMFNDLGSSKRYIYNYHTLSYQTEEKEDFDIEDFHHYGGNYIEYYSYNNSNGNNKKHSMVISKNSKKSQHLLYNPESINRDDVYGALKYFYYSNGKLYFTQPFDYGIYKINVEGDFINSFVLDFIKIDNLPKDFLTNDKYKNNRLGILASKNYIHSIKDVYETDNIISFTTVATIGMNNFLYKKVSDSVMNISTYISDERSYRLPIGSDIIGVDKNWFISYVKSNEFVEYISRNILNYDNYLNTLPQNLKLLYDKGNNENPMLLFIKYK